LYLVSFLDLDKLNLDVVVWFWTHVNFFTRSRSVVLNNNQNNLFVVLLDVFFPEGVICLNKIEIYCKLYDDQI